MTDQDRSAEGHSEGRTPAAQDLAPELEQLLGSIAPQASLPGLIDSDSDAADLLGRVAETVNEKRRARGRPLNSPNRRNDETFDYLAARGFKMPEVRLMEIVTADPRELAAALAGSGTKPENVSFDRAMEVLRLQAKCAEVLMPYKFAKKQELKVEHRGGQVHVMMAGPLTRPGDDAARAFDLTAGASGQTVEYQAVTPSTEATVGSDAVGQKAQSTETT